MLFILRISNNKNNMNIDETCRNPFFIVYCKAKIMEYFFIDEQQQKNLNYLEKVFLIFFFFISTQKERKRER